MSIFATNKGAGNVEEQLSQLRRRVAELESDVKIGKLEAAEVYDKTLRLMNRMKKRYELDLKENGGAPPVDQDPTLSDGLDPISRSILQRRARLGKQM